MKEKPKALYWVSHRCDLPDLPVAYFDGEKWFSVAVGPEIPKPTMGVWLINLPRVRSK